MLDALMLDDFRVCGLPISKPMPDPDSPKCRQGASRKTRRVKGSKVIQLLTTKEQGNQEYSFTALFLRCLVVKFPPSVQSPS
jgi:hypothetical protein